MKPVKGWYLYWHGFGWRLCCGSHIRITAAKFYFRVRRLLFLVAHGLVRGCVGEQEKPGPQGAGWVAPQQRSGHSKVRYMVVEVARHDELREICL